MARKSITALNAKKTNPVAAHVKAEQMAAGWRSVSIDTIAGEGGSYVRARVRIWWLAGRKVQTNALLAQVYHHIAEAFEVAAHQGVDLLQPAFEGIMSAGGDRAMATLAFETNNGTYAEAERIVELLHDVFPAPL